MASPRGTGTTPSGLVYDQTGAGEPGVVLVHSGISDRSQWDGPFQALADRCRALRYDVRGFGESPDPNVDYFDHVDLVEVMDAAGMPRAVVVGSSNGGRIALDTAVSHPGRVAGLVLIGSALPGMPSSARLEAIFSEEEAGLARGDVAAAVDANLRAWVTGVGRAHANVAVEQRVIRWLEAILPRQAAADGEAHLLEPLVRDRLGEIAVPAIVMVGDHDQPEMHRNAGFLAAGIRDARLEVIDGTAHLPDLERPGEFASLLHRFLDAVLHAPAPTTRRG